MGIQSCMPSRRQQNIPIRNDISASTPFQLSLQIKKRMASLIPITRSLIGISGDRQEDWKYIQKSKYYYKGQWKDNNIHGFGDFFYPGKKKYVHKAFILQGNLQKCFCRMFFEDGSYYEGKVNQNHIENGNGFFVNKDDSYRYDGEFVNGLKHGEGVQKVKSVVVFQGIFENGQRKKGKQRDSKGYYEGEFKNNARSGYGVYTWQKGGRFEGNWLNNQKNGQGKLYDSEYVLVRKGNWAADHMF